MIFSQKHFASVIMRLLEKITAQHLKDVTGNTKDSFLHFSANKEADEER